MSWAAIVSGKGRHTDSVPTPTSQHVPCQPNLSMPVSNPLHNSAHPPLREEPKPQQSKLPSTPDKLTHKVTRPPKKSTTSRSSPPTTPQSRQNRNRQSKQHQHQSSQPQQHQQQQQSHPQQQQSMWDDPRLPAIFRLWTHHITSFMAQPVHFFHFFVMNPQFRQSVFDAGLTFSPDTDPSNPILINLNSARFGMSERISALAPPASLDMRNTARPANGTLPLPGMDASPVVEMRPVTSPPQLSPQMVFLSPAVCDLFEAAKAATIAPNQGDTIGDVNGTLSNAQSLDVTESMRSTDSSTNSVDVLTQQFVEDVRVSASTHEQERPRETNKSQAAASKSSKKGRSGSNRHNNSPSIEKRLPGRLKVVSRMRNVRIPSSPVCKQQSESAKTEMIRQIEEIFPRITPSEEFAAVRADLLKRLRDIISEEWEGAGIDIYGSAGNGLGLRSADVDMSLYMPNEIVRSSTREDGLPDLPKDILARLAAIMELNNMVILSKLLEARVPVIKMQDPESKIQIDVCMNNILAVRNTELLKAYVDLDPRFRHICILVKLWAKRRDLNDAYHGTLSSYAYTLLVIHYLQTLEPPVLPCLQQTVNGKRVAHESDLPKEMTDNGHQKLYNTYFDRTVTPITFQSANTSTVYDLLLGFFRYYAYTFQYRTDLASIRLGIRSTREERGWDEQSVYREWEAKQAQFKAAYDVAKTALDDRKKTDGEEKVRLAKLKKEKAGGDGVQKQGSAEVPAEKRERIVFPRRPRLESKHLFCIEDPFDIDHDLSRGMEKSAVTVIRQEMVRAYEALAEKGDFEAACEEWRES